MKNTPLDAIRCLTTAWKRKDAAEMSLWLDDGIVEVGPAFARPLEGKRDFFSKYREYLGASRRVRSYRILRPRTFFLAPDVAQVYFSYSMRVVDGDSVEDSRGKESMLVVRQRGRWKVRFIHWHRDA